MHQKLLVQPQGVDREARPQRPAIDGAYLERLRSASFPLERRGYGKREVDAFMDRLADWLEHAGHDQLRARLLADAARLDSQRRSRLAEAEREADSLRRAAADYVEERRGAADLYSEIVRREADEHADRVRQEAARTIAAARTEAKRIVDEANARRRRLQAEALADLDDDFRFSEEYLSEQLDAAFAELEAGAPRRVT